jgi:DNA-binding CsgD family transcriptional regulator
MWQGLNDFIEKLNLSNSMEELSNGVLALGDVLDVEHVVFHAINHSGSQYVSATYSQTWQDHYELEDLTRIDPVILAGRTAISPVNWNRLDWTTKPAKRLLHDATDAGVGNQGLSVPARGPRGQFAVLTISDTASADVWDRRVEQVRDEVLYLSQFVNAKAVELYGKDRDAPVPVLSPRESDALVQLALGRSRSQAADALGISEHTLRVYIEGARLKLGAKNTVHAVAKSVALGLVAI